MNQLTLKGRITNFIIVFMILLISTFTVIQVNNQLNTITNYNSYRAKVSVLLLKTVLDRVIENAAGGIGLNAKFNESLATLKKSGLIEDGSVISKDNIVVASTIPAELGVKISPEDAILIKSLSEAPAKKKGTLSYIDKSAKLLFMYIGLGVAGGENYFVRAIFSLGNIQEAMHQVYIPIIFTVASVIVISVIFGIVLSKTVVGPIMELNKATKNIASGNLDLRVSIRTGDELEELTDTFNDMTLALKKMKERAENANPLTKLPGNNIIREEVEKRISAKEKFVVVHVDLDNFKAFNDKYGMLKGDEAIKLTSQVLEEALTKEGAAGDFLGHEGGDDFVYITTPEKAEAVASYVIKNFDEKIRALYSQEDLIKGYIISHSRDGKVSDFPIMTISLSGVSNIYKPLESYAEVTNIAAEVKLKVKGIEKSVYLLDKRGKELDSQKTPSKT